LRKGLLDDFRARTSAQVQGFEARAISVAKYRAQEMLFKGWFSYSTAIHKDIPYDFAPGLSGFIKGILSGDPLVVLGNGSIGAVASITVRRLHDGTKWLDEAEWTVQFEYRINDSFKDPLDTLDLIPGDWELPGGKIYAITGYWSSEASGTVKKSILSYPSQPPGV